MTQQYSRVLVLAAHPDDEAIGCLGWLHRRAAAVSGVVFLTDGAPQARWCAQPHMARADYRCLRRREARTVWRQAGVELYFSPIADQQLAFRLDEGYRWLAEIVERVRPQALLAPAFEGGHMDHDATNLLAYAVARIYGAAAWEYALYTAYAGAIRRQCFPLEPQWLLRLTGAERTAKQAALDGYASQAATLEPFDAGQEAVRPLAAHNYRQPALHEASVYERWGWPWRAEEIARHCARFLAAHFLTCAC